MSNYFGAAVCSEVRVSTGSRLHFGLFDVKAPFGGVGMMIDHPRTTVSVSHSEHFVVHPCQVDRITEIAKRLALHLSPELTNKGLPRCALAVETAAEPHCGLGSGTQLSLAVSVALVQWFGLHQLSRDTLISEIASRGRRSLIGSIGFFEGGLISEEGTALSYEDRKNWNRADVPEAWRVLLVHPRSDGGGVCGEAEGAAFASLPAAEPAYRARLAGSGREILHWAAQSNFSAFSQTVARFNAMSGQLFAAHQGGCYNGAAVTSLVERIRGLGVEGVGQSSWGPTVFAFCDSHEMALTLKQDLADMACRIVGLQASGYWLERSPSTSCK